MPDYTFTGRATLEGVRFTVTARNKSAAIAKAKEGKWDYYMPDFGEVVDWKINPDTLEKPE